MPTSSAWRTLSPLYLMFGFLALAFGLIPELHTALWRLPRSIYLCSFSVGIALILLRIMTVSGSLRGLTAIIVISWLVFASAGARWHPVSILEVALTLAVSAYGILSALLGG
jgi:hypothetical protein